MRYSSPASFGAKMNVIADSLIRKSQILSTEWVLHRQVCADLWKRWGRPLVDLFATRLNYRIPTFCSPCPVSHGSGNGRVPPSMGRTRSLCLSPIPFDQEDTQQIEGVKEDGNDLNCPGLAPTGMVSGPPSADNGAPGPPSTQTRSSQTTTQRSALPRSPQASALRVETVQRLLKHKGFSSEVAKTVASSRRRSANVDYQYKWHQYREWCRTHGKSSSRPSIPKIADFLPFLRKEKKLSVSAVRGYRSMLSSVLKHKDLDIAHNPVLTELLAAFEREIPPWTVPVPSWNLDVVLRAFSKPPFNPLGEASFKLLFMETLFLLALASAT